MVIQTKDFKNMCNIILAATQGSQAAVDSNELELRTVDNILFLNIASSEYSVSTKFKLQHTENFHATVNASLFLKLITQITTEDIVLKATDNFLTVAANGNYKIPLIYNNGSVLEIPSMIINNPTVKTTVPEEILSSILNYNSKELLKGTISTARPSQRYYYLDEEGCITYTTGACVNSFHLEQKIRILLTNKIVKLFKLFKGSQMVELLLSHSKSIAGVPQVRVAFESEDVSIRAVITYDDSLIDAVPAKVLRNRATMVYPYEVSINRSMLLQAINRLLLFNSSCVNFQAENIGTFVFSGNDLQILDFTETNSEAVTCSYSNLNENSYKAFLNLQDLKTTLETMNDINISLGFGDNTAFVLKKDDVTLLIPQCVRVENHG